MVSDAIKETKKELYAEMKGRARDMDNGGLKFLEPTEMQKTNDDDIYCSSVSYDLI